MTNKIHSLCTVLIFVCSISVGQTEKQIRWQFNVGDECRVELKQTTGITTNIDTRRKQIGNEMLLLLDWKIDNVDQDSISITQSIRRIKLTVKSPTISGIQTTEIDTDSDKAGQGLGVELLKQIQPLLNARIIVVMTTRGEIKEVNVPRESMDAVREAPASMILRQALSEDGLKDLLGQSAIVFPVSVSSGDTWSHSQNVDSSFGKIKKTNSYVYNGTKEHDGVEVEEFAMAFEIVEPDESVKEANVEDFSGTGKIWFAAGESNILESLFENSMKTSRTYRDKKIVSRVSTSVSMKVSRTK